MQESWSWFFNPHVQFSWIWLLEFLILGTLIGIYRQRRAGEPVLAAFSHCLPRPCPARGRQFLFDVALTLFNLFLMVKLTAWLEPWSKHASGNLAVNLPDIFRVDGLSQTGLSFYAYILYPVGAFLAADFLYTLAHIAFHKVPLLWRMHKIHHAPQSLSPATAWRIHPLEIVTTISAVVIGNNLFKAFITASLGAYPETFTIYGLSWFEILLMTFVTFRHSDIWISFGPLNYFISSPAMHQIHHSSEVRHRDKNFALFLSFWDFVFGTLYLPQKKETFAYGIAGDADACLKNSHDVREKREVKRQIF